MDKRNLTEVHKSLAVVNENDWIEIGGNLFRVFDVSASLTIDAWTVRLTDPSKSLDSAEISAPRHTLFTVYTQ